MDVVKIVVSVPVRSPTLCGCCPLIYYAHDDDPIRCTAFQQEFGPENTDSEGRRIRLPQCVDAEIK